MSTIAQIAANMKLESPVMAATSLEMRNDALARIREALLSNKEAIFAANAADLAAAEESGVAAPIVKRLKFDEGKLAGVCEGIADLIKLADPVGHVSLKRELDEGLVLVRETVPIGVIGVIFEARPDALVQISTLCLKSGNCAVLKGGSETMNTNKALFEVIHAAAVEAGLPATCLFQAEAREEISELLACDESVDLLIPRGSNAFVRYIMDNTRIPVMGHADGICHVYVDADADVQKAVDVVVDAKTQYVAVCNAAETLLVARGIAPKAVPAIAQALANKGVEVRGDAEVQALVDCVPATDEDWDTEYLSLTISIKVVDGVDEAIEHINKHGSHHTDAIVTENAATAERFLQLVDSAGVYWNVSTRFADGFRYGFGAEVGISTSKLHARGPVGLDGLVTYKYKLCGNGHVVADYASGVRSFHFRDLM
ncbi:MAG: glutamate-5-semialdehyde dehydrogenase [Atopobiaceae bacterium]|nr:glutamate-5-semialdehyde dehydrogenase [Atopobiaceae bacterium]